MGFLFHSLTVRNPQSPQLSWEKPHLAVFQMLVWKNILFREIIPGEQDDPEFSVEKKVDMHSSFKGQERPDTEIELIN